MNIVMEAQIAKKNLYKKLQVLHGNKNCLDFEHHMNFFWKFMKIHHKLT